jgi:hypothetical protein
MTLHLRFIFISHSAAAVNESDAWASVGLNLHICFLLSVYGVIF